MSLLVNSYDKRHALWMTSYVVENTQKDNKAEQGGHFGMQSTVSEIAYIDLSHLDHFTEMITYKIYCVEIF